MMETRNLFKTLSDGRFEGDRLDEPPPQPKPIVRFGKFNVIKRLIKTVEERRQTERQRKREYNKRHPEQKRAESHNRRARIKQAGGRLTTKECREIFEKHGKRCLKCGSDDRVALDHVVPLALGGMNIADNMQPLCMMCNSYKGASVADYR